MTLRKKRQKLRFCLIFALLAVMLSVTAGAQSYTSYVYDAEMKTVAAPVYYGTERTIYGEEITGGPWLKPVDIAYKNGFIALLDSGSDAGDSCVYLMDSDFKLIMTVKGFMNGGAEDSLLSAQGIFLTDEYLYVADTGNGRIAVFDFSGSLVRTYGRPQTELLDASLKYQPKKITVDEDGRMYVVAISVNQGLIELESDGSFLRFMGANAVKYNMIEYIWRMFSTEEQLARMNLFVPTEYTNLSIDTQGFIYAVNGTSSNSIAEADIVKRLNPKGSNVLKQNGYVPPVGDILDNKPYSVIVDIDVSKSGIYAILDSITGRVFVYDNDGNMLTAFGGSGERQGLTQIPAAICYLEDKILVVDSYWKAIICYKLTPYGEAVQKATELYENGYYSESSQQWNQALKYNANSDLAYTGIGKVALRTGDYKLASEYFRLSEQRLYYSKAYKQYRWQQLEKYFPAVAAGILLLVAAFLLFRIIRGARVLLIRLSDCHDEK